MNSLKRIERVAQRFWTVPLAVLALAWFYWGCRVDHRQGEVRTVGCVPRQQDEDPRGPEEDRPDEEQDREDREQEGQRQWQEGLRPHQGLDHGCAEGAQGAWRQRLPGGEE